MFECLSEFWAFVSNVEDIHARDEGEKDKVLALIYTAANETKNYLTEVDKHNSTDPAKETDLCRLWKRAAVPLRQINRDLAEPCPEKGCYWVSPHYWNGERWRTRLDQILNEVQDLL